MALARSIAVLLAAATLANSAAAAELPSQSKKANPPEAAKRCDIAGSPGILGPNGVCVRLSGYVSTQFTAGRLK
jgi:hypothetical protein